MKVSKKLRMLVLEFILYWLIISNTVAPILCMDADQPSKGILNADLPMPGADVPIISLSTTSPQKSSKAYSQVCTSPLYEKYFSIFMNQYLMLSYFRNIYTHQKKKMPRENINVGFVLRILKLQKD